MTALSAATEAAALPVSARPRWTDGPLPWLALAAALVTSLALAWPGLDVLYRFDEVQSVAIADRPLADVPAALRLDGAPPLYYVLLNLWMKVFGTSPAATHSLSILLGLGTIVAAAWLADRLAGRAAAVLAAWLVAANPFAALFFAETRNYTLFALLGLLAVGFGDAAVHDGRRGDVVRFGLALAALLYTHAWGPFVALSIVLCLGAWSWTDRAATKRVAIAAVIAGVAFLPWLPIAYDQAQHTAAPWLADTSLKGAIFSIDTFFGSRRDALIAVAVLAVTAALAWRRRSDRFAYVALAVGPLVLAMAWLVSTAMRPIFVPRYGLPALAIVFVAWAALAVAHRAAVALSVIVIVLGLLVTADDAADLERYSKSPVLDMADEVAATDVDLVIANEEDLVTIARATDGVALVGPTGPLVDDLFDWRDDLEDLRDADVAATVNTALAALEPGQRVALVWDPTPRDETTEWQSRFYSTMVDAVQAVESYGLTPVDQQTFTMWEITVFEK